MKPFHFSTIQSVHDHRGFTNEDNANDVAILTLSNCTSEFATMDLVGLPWRVTVGPRGLAKGVGELTSRRTGDSEEMSPEAVVDRIAAIYAAL